MGKRVKGLVLVALLMGLGLLLPRTSYAIGGVSNDSYSSETYTPINGSISTTAGNIYQFNLSTQERTYRWVGLWGNITGAVQLRTSTNTFYEWTVSTISTGSVVYATTDISGIDPTNFVATNGTYTAQADTQWGYLTGLTDNIWSTYNSTNSFQSPSMQTAIQVNSTTVGAWTNNFIKKVAGDLTGKNDVVWAADVIAGQAGFNGQLMDYELMIPENEESGDPDQGVATVYYLWVEIQ